MFTGIVVGTGKVEKITKNTKNRTAVKMTVNLGKHSKGFNCNKTLKE
jgi:riboflavin synthase